MHHWVNIMNLANYIGQLPRGGKKLFAIKLGVTASYLSRLVSGDRSITAERAIQIESATHGMVSRAELRPDIQWEQPKRKKKSLTQMSSTTNQTIRATRPRQQVTGSAVNPSSTARAAP